MGGRVNVWDGKVSLIAGSEIIKRRSFHPIGRRKSIQLYLPKLYIFLELAAPFVGCYSSMNDPKRPCWAWVKRVPTDPKERHSVAVGRVQAAFLASTCQK